MRILAASLAVLWLVPVTAAAQNVTPPAPTTATERCLRCNTNFLATFFTGLQIDSFAAEELRRYLNPEESGKILERMIAGFDFQYRMFGKPDDTGNNVWIYGETIHGIRSADVDCKADANLPVCKPYQETLLDPGGAALFILRNASTLEAFMGFRYEFWPVQSAGPDPARLYVKGQAGFLNVAGSGKDVIDMHHVGIGAMAVRGRYQGSYVELGVGRTDLYELRPAPRLKVDGFLTWPVAWLEEHVGQPFVQMTVDADLREGADSVQSFFGFDFDLSKLWKDPAPKTQRSSPRVLPSASIHPRRD